MCIYHQAATSAAQKAATFRSQVGVVVMATYDWAASTSPQGRNCVYLKTTMPLSDHQYVYKKTAGKKNR